MNNVAFNHIICIITIFVIPFINISNVEVYAVNPIIADHNAVAEFENIPDSLLSYTIPMRFMFQHASVGTTINDGLNCVQGTRTNPKECDEFPDYKYDRRNWEFQPRGNSGWYEKIKYFADGVETQFDKFDIFSFKFCYLEGLDGQSEPCGNPLNLGKVEKAWSSLRDSIDALEKRYPSKIFVWWTIPLTQVGMFCTDTLNAKIRNYCKEKGKILFDIADIESYDTLNIHTLNNQGWEKAFKPYCGEKNPNATNCHPDWLCKLRLAKAFWWMMTKIAETNITDAKESNQETDNEFYKVLNQANSFIIQMKNNNNSSIKVSLYDIMGSEIIRRIQNDAVNDKIEINTFGIVRGLYFLTVSDGEKFVIGKIIIDD